MKKPFSILKEDIGAVYMDTRNCSFANAFKRQFPHLWGDNVGVGTTIIVDKTEQKEKFLGVLKNEFGKGQFKRLRDKGEEFHTEIEIFDEPLDEWPVWKD